MVDTQQSMDNLNWFKGGKEDNRKQDRLSKEKESAESGEKAEAEKKRKKGKPPKEGNYN